MDSILAEMAGSHSGRRLASVSRGGGGSVGVSGTIGRGLSVMGKASAATLSWPALAITHPTMPSLATWSHRPSVLRPTACTVWPATRVPSLLEAEVGLARKFRLLTVTANTALDTASAPDAVTAVGAVLA